MSVRARNGARPASPAYPLTSQADPCQTGSSQRRDNQIAPVDAAPLDPAPPQPHDADTFFACQFDPVGAPEACALLVAVVDHFAMRGNDRVHDLLDDAGAQCRLDHAHNGDMGRDTREVELIDSRANRKHYLQIGQSPVDIVRHDPGGQILDLCAIVHVGPYMKRAFGHLPGKMGASLRPTNRIQFIQKGHRWIANRE